MVVTLLLALVVTVAAFSSGFALARRPALVEEILARLYEGFTRAIAWGRERISSARHATERVWRRVHPSAGGPIEGVSLEAIPLPREATAVVRESASERTEEGASAITTTVPSPLATVAAPLTDGASASKSVSKSASKSVSATTTSSSPSSSLAPLGAAPLAPLVTLGGVPSVRFDPVAARGTHSAELERHSPEWRAAMAAVGERFAAADVGAIVFVHGTFTGSDPLSAYSFVERALPSSIGPQIARSLRQKTRRYVRRVLGDLGNFGTAYVRLFEEAIRPRGARIPCTDFVWSSENHHVGRLEGALGLVRVLATHAELGGHEHAGQHGRPRRLLVIGHSHAGQLFALVTQLLARSMATEAILDVARARDLDVAALETDLATLTAPSSAGGRTAIDFVTFGAPNRYAWATVPNVRALHVIGVPPIGSRGLEGDWIRRLAVEGSDFPPLAGEDRRINEALSGSLGHAGFAPTRVAAALRAGVGLPSNGEVAFVEYGERSLLSTGLGHGTYTRLDGMLFHARLVAERLYAAAEAEPEPEPEAPLEPAPLSARAWSVLRGAGPASKSPKPRPTP